jgi:CBS domain containing-hemolysin-like protein
MSALPGLPVSLLLIAASLALVLLNAFFVASEFAIVKVRRTRLEELAGQGVSTARLSIVALDNLDEYLSATQLGITVVSLGLGWIGEEAFAGLLAAVAPSVFSPGHGSAHVVGAVLSFLVITGLHIVLGELVPKSLAIQNAERMVLLVTRPLHWFYRASLPMIRTFSWLAAATLRLLGYRQGEEAPLSENELKLVMKESHEEGVISESEAQIIARAFSFSDKRAADIMVPAARVDYLSLAQPLERNLQVLRRNMRTRFPLCRVDLDTVVGVVHIKDAWPMLLTDFSNAAFEKTARPPVFVESTLREDQLMKIFQRRHHLAIVRDPRTARAVGIVTLEDVLEELVGEIRDEHGN